MGAKFPGHPDGGNGSWQPPLIEITGFPDGNAVRRIQRM